MDLARNERFFFYGYQDNDDYYLFFLLFYTGVGLSSYFGFFTTAAGMPVVFLWGRL